MKIVGCFTEVEVVLPRKTLIEQIERLNKKFLKQILSLSKTTADPAVCVLSGTVSIEGVVHKKSIDTVWWCLSSVGKIQLKSSWQEGSCPSRDTSLIVGRYALERYFSNMSYHSHGIYWSHHRRCSRGSVRFESKWTTTE